MPKPVQASSYTFRNIVEGGFLYVDKTRYLYELIRHTSGIYFLSRPRRFGKSLTISTLEEIFRGNKELFRGLALYDSDYEWQVFPVIRLDFSRNTVQSAAKLEEVIDYYLAKLAREAGITLQGIDYQSRFEDLIQQLAETDGKVVILIDEYDKPILDNIENSAEARRIRDVLKAFYTVIKAADQYLRFVFITGISKFSRVGIFSGMNNLDDISMDARFATMLGITEEELRNDFQEHIESFSQKEKMSVQAMLDKIRTWYNGFCFVGGGQRIYNPFSVLQLFGKQRFANYWFETGTPTFLIKLLKERQYDIEPFEQLELTQLAFSTYEIESLALVPLLFQTGYLTIKDFRSDRDGESDGESDGEVYTLSYPNDEVKNAFLAYLLSAYNETEIALSETHLHRLLNTLRNHDLPEFFATLDVFFANVQYDLYLDHEKYYQTIFYLIFLMLGTRISAEVKTNRGRIDAVVEVKDRIFLFEFKLDRSAAEALQQLKDHEYFQKYRLHAKPLTLIGANFDSSKRKVSEWQHELNPA